MERSKTMIKKIYSIIAILLFAYYVVIFSQMIYDGFLYKSEICVISTPYQFQFEYPKGRICQFDIGGLIEPVAAFLFFIFITQLPLWLAYKGIIFLNTRKNTQAK
jgi:hypothetical protein